VTRLAFLLDAAGEREAVGEGTRSMDTFSKKNMPNCNWRGRWRPCGGDALMAECFHQVACDQS
jgi:hypothetical protein